MTVAQAVERSALLYPSDMERLCVYEWLSELEGRIFAELYGQNSEPFGKDDAERELSVPDAYAELYPLYIIMKTDMANADIQRYKNSLQCFERAYAEYCNYYNRSKKLGQSVRIKLL